MPRVDLFPGSTDSIHQASYKSSICAEKNGTTWNTKSTKERERRERQRGFVSCAWFRVIRGPNGLPPRQVAPWDLHPAQYCAILCGRVGSLLFSPLPSPAWRKEVMASLTIGRCFHGLSHCLGLGFP